MDSDWCLFCEKHVQELDALYCSKECARKDKLMATSSKSAARLSTSNSSNITAVPQANNTSMSFRRPLNQSTSVTIPGFSRRGVTKSFNISNGNGNGSKLNLSASSTAAAAMSVRSLPLSRSSTRRQPLVLYDKEEE